MTARLQRIDGCSPARDVLRRSAVLAFTLALAACSSQPVPLAVQAGSSFTLAVSGELLDGDRLGYGGDWLEQAGRLDMQRGELLFVLRDDTGAEWTLHTRLVTRVTPDPASDAALDQRIDPWLGSAAGFSQAIALVEIPADVPPAGYALELRRRRRLPSGSYESLPAPQYSGALRVLPALVDGHAGQSNQPVGAAGAWIVDTRSRLAALHPNPKLVLSLDGDPAAAHLVLEYPRQKLVVRGVIEEQHSGRSSVVAWRDDPVSGRVTVDLVAPLADVAALALVFTLRAPDTAGVAAPSDFRVLAATLFDAGGGRMPGSVSVGAIR